MKRICIVGAGPSGLAALKTITVENEEYQSGEWSVEVYEARDNLGGIWLPSLPKGNEVITPLYDSMTTNIPHPVMPFGHHPFPSRTPLFPPARTVLSYIQDFARTYDLTPSIRFNTRVLDLSWNADAQTWSVTADSPDGQFTKEFDHVLVANGHFSLPRYPEIPGLDRWLDSGRAFHSAYYRSAQTEVLRDASAIAVVGAGPSALDIVADLLGAGKRVVHSTKQGHTVDTGSDLMLRSQIERFDSGSTLVFRDGVVEAVDCCILATGYQYSFPFIPDQVLPSIHSIEVDMNGLSNSSYHLTPLMKHIFPITSQFPPTSLCFIGLILRGTPFSLFEAQAHAVVSAIRDPSSLDIEKERRAITDRMERLRLAYPDDPIMQAKEYHRPTEAEAFAYRDELYEFAGLDRRVSEWEEAMWTGKMPLRKGWREIERRGEARDWLADVESEEEWVELMRKVMRFGEIL